MDRNPVYDWYQRHGLRYFVGSTLGETQRYNLMWSLQRTQSQGHVQAADVEHFERIKPHMERALGLADQIGTLRSYQRFSSALIEALPQAVFALDGEGRILFANGMAEEMLRSADGLADVEGLLRPSYAGEQARLDELVRGAINPLEHGASGWLRISRPSGKLPYAAFISPLVISTDDPMMPQAKALIVVHDTGVRNTVDPDMLKSVYGLTETEARVAAALAEGHSVESAAILFAMQPATARSHLKAIFGKVGVHRQQDLTRLLAFLSTIRPDA